MTAEIVPVMLGIVRAGMIAVPLFSGFGEEPVRVRIEDSESKVIFTVTSYERKGREIDLSKNLEKLRVTKVALNEGRKEIKDYHDLKDVFKTGGDGYEESEAEDPMMIVYTSGTTGRPKGCVHVHGGFPIKASADMYFHFDVRKGETVSWITDMGWMMGPWLVFGSLLLRSNVALFDGVPSAVTLSQFIESTSLSILGMSATLIRTLRSQSPDLRLEVRVVGNTGEPIDPENWTWIQKVTSAPVINYSGGTEISGGILGN
jgi:acetyl-CoA synthetase